MSDEAKIAELEAKVALFERVIHAFVQNPFIYQSPTFRGLVEELGYEYVADENGRDGNIQLRPR